MTERLITARRQDCCGVRLLAEFKKRNAERKGGKKEEKDEKAKRAVKGKFQPGNRPSMYQ